MDEVADLAWPGGRDEPWGKEDYAAAAIQANTHVFVAVALNFPPSHRLLFMVIS